MCGGSAMREALIKWHIAGADPAAVPSGRKSWSLLVIERRSEGIAVTYYDDDSSYPLDIALPFAMGTGEAFAMGAMDAGATPEEAVAIAAKRDPSTGGIISVFDIEASLGEANHDYSFVKVEVGWWPDEIARETRSEALHSPSWKAQAD